MEMRHGLSFIWGCVSANREEDFQAVIITLNTSDAMLRLLEPEALSEGADEWSQHGLERWTCEKGSL